jgi:II/X family phage/plasmid replication protein
LIDWITAVIPCYHEEAIKDGCVFSVKNDGEVEWSTPERKMVEGSFSSRTAVKTEDEGYQHANGSRAIVV